METGIIGLPLSGKTTLFNALTGLSAETSSYTGGKKQLNVAEVSVPDERVDKLNALFHPKKKTYANVLVKDIPVAFDASRGILPSSLGEIRNSDAITIVLRAFKDKTIPHPLDNIDPTRDLNRIVESLIFSDYEIIEKRLERLEREGKKNDREYHILKKIGDKLEQDELVGTEFLNSDEKKIVSGFRFFTIKPLLVVVNLGEDQYDISELEKKTQNLGLNLFPIQGKIEMEISQLPREDQKDFLNELGIEEPALNRFLREVFNTLNLISFFTVGEDEVRAWSIPKGTNAQKAAGKIHTDLEKGFIRAEVIRWDELLRLGGIHEAKKAGKIAIEGKEYIVKDGDVIVVRFNI